MKNEERKIYAIRNPFWLSDIFICAKIKGYDKYCYVKLNLFNKIEEIGIDAEERLHVDNLGKMESYYEPVTKTQKIRFNSIGNEYWWGKISDRKDVSKQIIKSKK